MRGRFILNIDLEFIFEYISFIWCYGVRDIIGLNFFLSKFFNGGF